MTPVEDNLLTKAGELIYYVKVVGSRAIIKTVNYSNAGSIAVYEMDSRGRVSVSKNSFYEKIGVTAVINQHL